MPQFHEPQKPALIPRDLAVGLTLISVGLFKKVVLADSLAQVVDPVFDLAATGAPYNSVDALLAMFGFQLSDLFRFFRLYGYGYWQRTPVRNQAAGEFQVTL